MGVEDRPVALKQFEPEQATGDVAGEGDGGKPGVRSVTGAEFGAGTAVGAAGGPWPETVVSGSVAAGGEDGAGAGGKLLRSY